MLILGIESSAKSASVAVCDGERLIAQTQLNTAQTHSQTLLPVTADLLRNAGLSLSDMEMFAVAAGPGSFTGLRIGIAQIKAFASAENKPCAPVSTLEAMAWGVSGLMDGIVCAVMDARCEQVYTAMFEVRYGAVLRLSEDAAISLADLDGEIKKLKKPVMLVGDGAEIWYNSCGRQRPDKDGSGSSGETTWKANFSAEAAFPWDNEFGHMDGAIRMAPPQHRLQTGYGVCRAALELYSRGGTVAAAALEPQYLRMPQAERERIAREALARERDSDES